MAYQHPDPFWDFIRNFDPNNAGSNNGPSPEFLRGFPFFHPAHAHPTGGRPHHHGPGGRHGPRRHGPPHGGPQGPPPQAWAGPFAWADWVAPGQGPAPWFQQQEQQQSQQQQQRDQQQQDQDKKGEQQEEQKKQRQQQDKEKSGSPDTMMGDSDVPDPAEVTPDEDEQSDTNNNNNPPPYGRGHCRRGAGRHCRNREGRRSNNQETPYPFDLSSLLGNLSSHPFVQNLQNIATEASRNANASSTGTFSPPLDLFNTPSAYILHFSVPGALKSDIGVDWDPERNVLRVAGVVHRPGDEEFQNLMVQSERRVGEFEREVRLPPKTWAAVDENGKEEEVDMDGITAKMEDGVLIVTVPKIEKEWTEIRKVDIE